MNLLENYTNLEEKYLNTYLFSRFLSQGPPSETHAVPREQASAGRGGRRGQRRRPAARPARARQQQHLAGDHHTCT